MRTYRALRGFMLGVALCGLAAVSLNFSKPGRADFYGESMPAKPGTTHINVKFKCLISAFGVAPWRAPGKDYTPQWELATADALFNVGVPKEAAPLAIAKLKDKPDGAIGMGNTHGTLSNGPQLFYPVFATTYKMGEQYTACLGSATNFNSDARQEFATVHRFVYKGETYWLGEFLACGNVTRFYPAPPGWVPFTVPPGGVAPSPGPNSGPGGTDRFGPGVVHQVPEPSSPFLLMLVIAITAWALVRK